VKTCSRCGETKDLAEFHKDRKTKDGYCGWCRVCACAKAKAWRLAHPERAKATGAAYYRRTTAEHKARAAAWAAANPERRREIVRAWDAAHAEAKSVRESARQKAQRAANPEEVRRLGRSWTAVTKARARGLPAEYFDYAVVLERDGLVCHLCLGVVAEEQLDFDHIVPFAHGGPHVTWNVAVAHRRCNLRKGNRPIPSKRYPYGIVPNVQQELPA
jgi:hypothetical protein